MALRDYSEDADYYTQGMEAPGKVSVWVGLVPAPGGADIDVLQDLCGVGCYALDNQEANASTTGAIELAKLLAPISYSASFIETLRARAARRGIVRAHWCTVQYDFDYRRERISRPVADQPVFLGAFDYSVD